MTAINANNDAYNNLTSRQKVYVDAIRQHGADCGIDLTKTEYSRAELRQVSMKMKGKKWIPNWITHDKSRRVGRGMFSIPEVPSVTVTDDATGGSPVSAEELVTA